MNVLRALQETFSELIAGFTFERAQHRKKIVDYTHEYDKVLISIKNTRPVLRGWNEIAARAIN
ncbi:MAG: hypothetical protein EBZ18_04370 [Alphaproteobacteria bacterium]|nr:hypothetical protein [Alphaproteobacteria bacterium]